VVTEPKPWTEGQLAETRVETGPGWELRLGRWQDVLADVTECDAVITDPPYLGAAPQHGGRVNGDGRRDRPGAFPRSRARAKAGAVMGYEPITADELLGVVRYASAAARAWSVVFNDFDGVSVMRAAALRGGLVVAEPLVWIKPPALSPPRGGLALPVKGCEFMMVMRQKATGEAGYMPGWYGSASSTRPQDQVLTGGKPVPLMCAIVRDYSRPGDLIVDPYAGGGTTLLAAAMEGRRAIGAEVDPETFEKAVKRLRAGIQVGLFA